MLAQQTPEQNTEDGEASSFADGMPKSIKEQTPTALDLKMKSGMRTDRF